MVSALITALCAAQETARAHGPIKKDRQAADDVWWYATLSAIDEVATPALAEHGLYVLLDGWSVRTEGRDRVIGATWTLVHRESGQTKTVVCELPMAWSPSDGISLDNAAKGVLVGLERYMLRLQLRLVIVDPEGVGDERGPQPRPQAQAHGHRRGRVILEPYDPGRDDVSGLFGEGDTVDHISAGSPDEPACSPVGADDDADGDAAVAPVPDSDEAGSWDTLADRWRQFETKAPATVRAGFPDLASVISMVLGGPVPNPTRARVEQIDEWLCAAIGACS